MPLKSLQINTITAEGEYLGSLAAGIDNLDVNS